MTLEWLLIVAAIAGVAAFSVLAVQRIVDDTTERPPPDDVRIVDAEIEAAKVAHEANDIFENSHASYVDSVYETRCIAVGQRFSDVLDSSAIVWSKPEQEQPGTPPVPAEKAKCILDR
ncbi:hypothetical protein [Candidatus Poriferisocius sp.]|uniref:hypothetical protein n=1 Tax=Candidatus Poriferisocius sp. TaxID=3101276 RepID=UPI003B025C52